MNFKVGDRVRAIEAHDGKEEIVGKIGTIRRINSHSYLVEFVENIKGHDGDGTLKNGHCWNCPSYVLEPLYREIKVGEKYRVKSFGKENGNVIEIVEIKGSDVYYKTLVGTNEHSNMFQIGSGFHEGLILYTDEKIVITTDGKTTTAKMYEGKKVVKEAKAVCSPDDKFDFGIGSALALERLVGNPKATLPDKPKFTKSDLKNGMFVLVENIWWGVVVGNRIVLEDGRYCKLNEFNTDLTSIFGSHGIIAVVKADCFNRAKENFKHAPDKVLFTR